MRRRQVTKSSGNGSIMRNAAVPVLYSQNIIQAEHIASKQSKTTHQGDEAAECCRLLTHICVNAINKQLDPQSLLNNILATFDSPLPSIKHLAASIPENADPINRNWNWKDPNFVYAPSRACQQPGYIGSYAMDAMSMALHCVWTTVSFKDAMLKCANIRGDSDSVCAVAGQVAGALYGLSGIPTEWCSAILRWDPVWDIPTRAYKLYKMGKSLSK